MTKVRDGRYLLVAAIVLEALAIWFVHWIDTRGYMDTEIYRLGARAWLNGYEIYGDLTPESPDSTTLPFIYPPFAAIVFTPLWWLSGDAAVVVVSVLSHLSILVTAYSFARSSPYLAPNAGSVAVATAVALPVMTIIEPTRDTVNYGQVNLLLMGLVAADCLLPRTRWPRGLLVGIAAAIKLTPLGFLLLFLLRKDFRAMSVAAVTFAGTVLLGLLAAPDDSADWWLDKMFSTGEDIGAVYAGNQTLRSLLAKQDITGTALDSLWIAGSLVLLVLAVLGMRYALRTRNVPLALVVNAVLVLLISPISWSHHWVWAGPALVLVLAMAWRHRWYGIAMYAGLCALAVLVAPHWYLPNTGDRELRWTFSQQVVGGSYALLGIGFLIACAAAHLLHRQRTAAEPAAERVGSGV
ncbi:glycosyltransferase 87 family protein [Saccharopolyspora sp. 6M]|uniref:glycosyltransferase 87 family protein n=1 Tax=Saccharopolyspora sp. 6M TaxID=2877237 RepID=UPI001CD426EF|nr:glycosyltransferase 87 family protein [Saccharopolyspora sp. 6M]MCA1227028.1 glycosyltransferase 87 family protein [Saccharopolyspora sp. 6M]